MKKKNRKLQNEIVKIDLERDEIQLKIDFE